MNSKPKLSLSIQFVYDIPEITRSKIRTWVQNTLNTAVEEISLADSVYTPEHEYELESAEITIRMVDEAEGKELNSSYRNRDYATNVLTFEYGVTPDGNANADIVLCIPVIKLEAQEQNKEFQHHLAHLIVHGVLHALGYDHTEEVQANHMEHIETTILSKMGISDPYKLL